MVMDYDGKSLTISRALAEHGCELVSMSPLPLRAACLCVRPDGTR